LRFLEPRTEKTFSAGGQRSNMIVPGSASQTLSAALAAETGDSLAPVTYERFPDGEQKVQVEADDDRAVIVAATVSDGAWVELLQLQDAVREQGVTEVTTIVPYMGYARQDRAFEAGDPVSARAMARAISTGSDRVLTVNPHERTVCDFFDVPAEPVDAAGTLAEPLGDLSEPLFLSPDEGAVDLAESVRSAYGGGETDYFEKTRHSGTEVEIEPSEAPVTDRDVVLVDDIIATGSTMSEAVGVLNDRGAGRVFVTCVHPLLVRNAYAKLARAGVEAVYGTDTIERPVSEVSVAPVLADALES
jgi:ribose-phosphate pyrophosphokinase